MYVKQNTVTKDVLATKGIRFANFIIDYFVQMGISLGIGFLIGISAELSGSYALADLILYSDSFWVDLFFGYFVLLLYYTTIETLTGRSIGKFVTNTKVVRLDGSKPTIDEILIRTLSRMIPFEAFSFLGEDAKGWHDSISKTLVVDIKKFEAKQQTIQDLDEIGQIGD